MNKFSCYSCNNTVETGDKAPFEKVTCSNCSLEVTIPKIFGDYIAVERLSDKQFYETYKGFNTNSQKDLVFKVIKKSEDFDEDSFLKMKTILSKVPENFKYSFHETEDAYLFIREWYETSVQNYLKASRPQLEKALYLLQGSANILNECSKKNIHPVELGIGNLLIDSNGRVILSDLLFKESLSKCLGLEKSKILDTHCISSAYLDSDHQGIENTLFAFGCLFHYICCGSYPWPPVSMSLSSKVRKIPPEILLNLRDKESKKLKEVLKKLIDENSLTFSDFESVIKSLENKPANKKSVKKKNLKPSNKLGKVKRKKGAGSNPVPLLAVCLICVLMIVLFAVLSKSSKRPQTAQAPKAQEKEVIPKKTVKKEIKKVPTPPKKAAETVVKTKIQPLPVKEELKKPKVNRESIKAELVPPDFNFDPLVDKLDEYIDATEEAKRELEEDKIEYVSTYRDHLLVHFYRRPYKGVFYIQKNKPFTGKIIKADENNIHIMNNQSKKTISVGWNDLEFIQFNEFADYYAARFANDFSLSENNSAVFSKIAEEYSKFAVVLDWYGFNKKAVDYKRKALKLDSTLADRLDELIKEEPTN